MKQTFFNLPPERQAEIKTICMREFITNGYEKASINRMIELLGIAKGSFYNYTNSKKELYFFLLRDIYTQAGERLKKVQLNESPDLFERIEPLMMFSFEICRHDPVKLNFLISCDLDTASPVYNEVKALGAELFANTYSELFEGVDWGLYHFSKEDILDIFSWLTAGVQNDLRNKVRAGIEIDKYEALVRKRLTIYRNCLTKGIYKNPH